MIHDITSFFSSLYLRECRVPLGRTFTSPHVDRALDAGGGAGEGLEESDNKRETFHNSFGFVFKTCISTRTTIKMREAGTQKAREREKPSQRGLRRVLDKGRTVKKIVTGSMQESAAIRSANFLTCATSVSRRATMRSTAKRSQRPTRRAPDSWTRGCEEFHRIQILARYYTCSQDVPVRALSVSGQGSLPRSGR